jgi:hypothetical protein
MGHSTRSRGRSFSAGSRTCSSTSRRSAKRLGRHVRSAPRPRSLHAQRWHAGWASAPRPAPRRRRIVGGPSHDCRLSEQCPAERPLWLSRRARRRQVGIAQAAWRELLLCARSGSLPARCDDGRARPDAMARLTAGCPDESKSIRPAFRGNTATQRAGAASGGVVLEPSERRPEHLREPDVMGTAPRGPQADAASGYGRCTRSGGVLGR